MPVRIQRKRTKGWRSPYNTIYVGRPTKWGNPFKVVKDGRLFFVIDEQDNYWGDVRGYESKSEAAAKAVECYSGWVEGKIGLKILDPSELKGKHLSCFCSTDHPCHADLLIEIANN